MTNLARNFVQSLLAIVIGNATYFLLLPHLPDAARHRAFRLDWGVVVDFWLCLVVYAVLEAARRAWRRGGGPRK